MKREERLKLGEWVLNRALKHGADQVAVRIANSRDIEIGFREKKIEKMQEAVQNSLSLDIYVQRKYSSHTTNHLKKGELEKFIAEAVAMTKFLTADPFRALPELKYFNDIKKIELQMEDRSYGQLDINGRIKIVREVEEAARAQSARIISVTAGYSDSRYETLHLTSNGFMGENAGTVFSLGAEVTVDDGQGGRPEDWHYCTLRFCQDLPDPGLIGQMAANRALNKIGQAKIQSGLYDIIVENRAGGNLLAMLYSPLRARALQQKSSCFDGKLKEKIASDSLTIIDDPFVLKALGSRLFDGEGMAARKRIIIEKGVLQSFYLDNYYGRKLELEPNGGSASNIVFACGTDSQDEMVKKVKRGILVNSFIGGNSNPTTGDFSMGMVGQYVENGRISRPVNEMNMTGNLLTFWKQLCQVGNDPYPYSSWQTPSLWFKDVELSGM